MCGIAGIFGRSRSPALDIARGMALALVHRGPDDAGAWSDEDAAIGLGHRRLSIIDLSPQGHQPMTSRSGRFVMAFNGEIYNHATLRAELDAAGVGGPWRGHSDTEVMLAAFEAWGIEPAVVRFLGMFAIALWDRTERRLHLLRDRMGEKPLYYGWTGEEFIFGSELKALLRCPGFAPQVERRALALYLRHMYVPAPLTIYSGIYKLEPGCMLSLGLNEAENRPHAGDLRSPLEARGLELRRWWSLLGALESGRASPLTHETQALEELERRLRDSIRLQSLADVPLGAFLSGGVDSSLIAALMQSESSSRIRTFTIGFREKQYNEAEHAAAVAKHLGTDHVELYVTANDALSVIERLPHLYDEPFSDSSQIPTFLLCAQARRYLTVALSGDAGDELFGGYNRYFWVRRIWDKLSWMPLSARRFFGRALSAVPADRWDKAYACVRPLFHPSRQVSLLGDKVHRLAERLDTVTDDDALFYTLVSEWKRPLEIAVGASEPDTLLTRRSEWPILEEVEDRMMYLDAMTYLPDDILVKVDRAAMGTSLETRVPMLDHRVVETAWRLPLGMKIRNGQGKWALRQILYKYVPRELIERPKQGFGIPLGAWLRGPLRDWAEDLLAERRLIEDGFLNPVPVRLKWREHLSGSRNWEHALWSVLMFQAWRSATK